MNNPVADKVLENQDGQFIRKKEYVKPTIDEGVEMPAAIAVTVFTPVFYGGD